MLNQEKNNYSEANNSSLCSTSNGENTAQNYSFNVEAVNDFFRLYTSPKDFAKILRYYNYRLMQYLLENASEITPQDQHIFTLFSDFAERLDPYFTTTKND